jgi:hypothetical protein
MIKDQTFDSYLVEGKSTRTLSLDGGAKTSKDRIDTINSSQAAHFTSLRLATK